MSHEFLQTVPAEPPLEAIREGKKCPAFLYVCRKCYEVEVQIFEPSPLRAVIEVVNKGNGSELCDVAERKEVI